MADQWVLLEIHGGIAWVTLNNPQRYNAFTRPMIEALQSVVQQLAVMPDLRAVVIHGGESKAFCSGADLKERITLDQAHVLSVVHLLRETITQVERLPVPVIAAMHGTAFGGGCELALACDLRIMTDDAQIGLTEVSIGVIPGAGGCARLPALIGATRAKEMIFTAKRLTAQEALQIGLINQVVTAGQLLQTAREVAERIAAMAPLAVRAAKRGINQGLALESALAAEWEASQSIIPTQDRLEGLRAFAEKRPPVFTGE